MATPTGAVDTYEVKGNREDLSDILYDVSPSETPILTMAKKVKATSTKHEWLADALRASADNFAVEGNDSPTNSRAARHRLDNYTQILTDNVFVTGTQEAMDAAGIKSEMAHQLPKVMLELKKDMERAIGGVSAVGKTAGDTSNGRKSGCLDTYLNINYDVSTAGTASTVASTSPGVLPGANGVATDISYSGTNRDISETIVKNVLQQIYTKSNGSDTLNLVCTAFSKGKISAFSASNTRYVTADKKKLTASIDVYEGDFHTVRIIPSRECHANLAYIIDPAYIQIAELRKMHSFDLARTGDTLKKQVVWECCLQISNPAAHGYIADLNNS